MSEILVTGGAGYVGLPLCKLLRDHGHVVTVIDNGTSGAARLEAVSAYSRVIECDITDRRACYRSIQTAMPEIVIHLAAIHFIPECNRRPVDAVRVNVLGTQHVLDACADLGRVSRVLVTSSAAVYPIADDYLSEAHPIGPTDIYGICKATNEWQAAQFAAATEIQTVVVRLFNVFGPGETNPHVIPEIIDQLKAGKSRLALGNTAPKRSYVYVDDVVLGFEAMATSKLADTFTILNLGHRDEASVLDLLRYISAFTKKELTVEESPERIRASDRLYLRCDSSRATQLTGWQPEHSIKEGMHLLLRFEGLC